MNAYRRLSAAWAVCIVFASLASAQYAHTYEDKDGEVVGIVFRGNSKWLVAQ